ncbi:MAG: aminoacyl-histidine dipeptidase [Bacteroidetes bacterium]|nr:aminoacyl-histidine dipeptidase [Bacteroidota bacterium]
MNHELQNLEPKALWGYFSALNAVPRASKKEERVIAFARAFGENLGLETTVDATGNVLIRKPATAGMENRPAVVLQSHLDMVHQKNSDTVFDFDTEGIQMRVDGDWVRARGTTLGADNGIGVASIMAILASEDIAHPALEALFTIDEETGMTGALGLEAGVLQGRIMLNLDTEDDTELTIGCAGGVDVTATGNYSAEPASGTAYLLTVSGLTGGHSGMDIHLGRGNANKMINRILTALQREAGMRLSSLDGGGLRNAIPRESKALFCVDDTQNSTIQELVNALRATLQAEYATTDPGLKVNLEPAPRPESVMQTEFQKKFLAAIYACPNGIYRMSPDIAGLVQTSNNLARVLAGNGNWTALCLTRSAVDSEKTDLAEAIRQSFELCGAAVELSGSYPGWTPAPGSGIVKLMRDIYQQKFNAEPQVNACHAGLECGILGRHYQGMEMISFGPNIRGAHSPDECVQISSVQKFWGYLLEVLKQV